MRDRLMPEQPEDTIVINRPRLVIVLGIELLGIFLMVWAILEAYILGGNPVHPQVLIPIGSVVLATGSALYAKVYDGPGLIGFGD